MIPKRTAMRVLMASVLAIAMVSIPASAQAARVLVTGHDADSHCMDPPGGLNPGSCVFVAKSVDWVRATAPNPSLPVLVLDRGRQDLQLSLAGQGINSVIVDPRSAAFASLPLSTSAYSAIAIASSKDEVSDTSPQDLNEFGSTPDTDAINARAADFSAFFHAGGGLAVFSGGAAARANSAKYYGFLKITRGGNAVAAPFSLTSFGTGIGFTDNRQPADQNMINCCETHVAFDVPAPESPLKVAETDRADKAVTLGAQTTDLALLEEPATSVKAVFGGLSKTACIPGNGKYKVSIKRPKGVRFAKITVYVNGKKKKTVKSKKLGSKSKTKAFTVKVSKTKTSKIKIVAQTAGGKKLTFKQTLKRC